MTQVRGYFTEAGRVLLRGGGWARPLACSLLLSGGYAFALATSLFATRLARMGSDHAFAAALTCLSIVVALLLSIGVVGYMLERARRHALGARAALGSSSGGPGHYLANGGRALVVLVLYCPVVAMADVLICMGIGALFGPSDGGLAQALFLVYAALFVTIVDLALAVVVVVACLCATLERGVGGALAWGRIGRMLAADTGGLLNIAGSFIHACGANVVLTTMALALFFVLPSLSETSRLLAIEPGTSATIMLPIGTRGLTWWRAMLSAGVTRSLPTLGAVAAGVVTLVTFTLFRLHVAVGLWMGQFDLGARAGGVGFPADRPSGTWQADIAPTGAGPDGDGPPGPPRTRRELWASMPIPGRPIAPGGLSVADGRPEADEAPGTGDDNSTAPHGREDA